MRKAYILAVLIPVMSVSVFGQKQRSQAEKDPMITAGTIVDAELQGMVDVKKSKVGDRVVLKTKKSIKEDGQVIIPKGTNLIGRITEVKQKTKDNTESRIGMVFDRIQGKNLDMPVNASIVSILTANANAAAGDLFSSDVSGGSTTSGSASSSGRSGGGGLLGGVGSTVGNVVGTATSTVGSVAGTATNTVGQTIGQTTGTIGRTVNGLQISSSASGSASSSSTISAHDKNVRLEKGATFQMRMDGSAKN